MRLHHNRKLYVNTLLYLVYHTMNANARKAKHNSGILTSTQSITSSCITFATVTCFIFTLMI